MLSEELLHIIAELLAYKPSIDEACLPELRHDHATREIHAFSLVNWQLRRICLPFLFAYVHIKNLSGVERFRDQCTLNQNFAASISTLRISELPRTAGCDTTSISLLLPRLQRLTCMYLGNTEVNAALLAAIHDHPNLTTAVTQYASKLPVVPNLSKVYLYRIELSHAYICEAVKSCISRGMKVESLVIHRLHDFHREYGPLTFPGLREIEITVHLEPITLEWLLQLPSTHPRLQRIAFNDNWGSYFGRKSTLSFVSSFLEEVWRQKLDESFEIEQVVISRSLALPEWVVTGMKISVEDSLGEILPLIASSFPHISLLSLKFKGDSEIYHIDAFIDMIRGIPSLRRIGLFQASRYLCFGGKKPWKNLCAKVDPSSSSPSCSRPKSNNAKMVEAAFLWHTTRITQAIPTIDAFFVHEDGSLSYRESWVAYGWLTVLDALLGSRRRTTGKLCHRP